LTQVSLKMKAAIAASMKNMPRRIVDGAAALGVPLPKMAASRQ